MKLLIVDEDQHFCRVVTTVLENDGHSVTALSDPPAAMAVCSSSAPDVLLLSGDLPGRAAHHLLREVRRRPGGDRIAAILMVENHSEEIRRLCYETGTHHVMIRPFSVLDLAGIVRAIDDPPPAPPAPSEVLHLDLHNVQKVARIWARESTGVLQLRGDPGGGSWITMARGGPLGPDSLTRDRKSVV